MKTRGERLRAAREAAGFKTASAAATALGMKTSSYNAHERAGSGGRDYDPEDADRYARRFKVSDAWLLTGKGEGPKANGRRRLVASFDPSDDAEPGPAGKTLPIIGLVGAGSQAIFFPIGGEMDRIPAPEWANEKTAAVEVRGDSLGALFDRWIVYYDDVQRPITSDMFGKMCVVGLADGRVMVKKIVRSKGKDKRLFDLLSNTEPPIKDTVIEWAAIVRGMLPR